MLNDAPLPLQTASPAPISDARAPVAFGVASLDAACRGGLARGALHEIYAATAADAASATGFALGLGCRAAGDKPIVWVRQDYLDTETGRLNAMGLLELGLDPGRIILVRAHNATDVLRAAGEAARCSAVGALLIEPWGTPRVLDLTASRRLTLATAKSGVTALMLRVCSSPSPSSAVTRWRVQPRHPRPWPPMRRAFRFFQPPCCAIATASRSASGLWSGTVTNDVSWIEAAQPTPPQNTPQSARPQSRIPRYLAVWFPFLAADRLAWQRRSMQRCSPASGGPDETAPHPPLILVEKIKGALRISATDARAARLGLRPGITLADARARIPVLDVAPDDAAADARFLNRLAQLCHDFTPAVALHPPSGVVLDITGCAHLFGGEAGLRDQACARLESFGLSLRASVAGTSEAAWAFVRFGRIAIVPVGADETHARQLPSAALGVAPNIVTALARAGLKTLGALADRSPAALAARFGEDLVVQLRRTLGHEQAPLQQLRPLPPIAVTQHFAEPLLHAEAIEDVLARLIEAAARIMEQRGVGGRRFRARFFHAGGATRRLLVETGRPSRDSRSILRLFHERLETLSDALDPGFGFDAIELAVPLTGPLDAVQTALDGHTIEEDAVTDLVDRLTVRLGSQRVLRFQPCDTHDPDREARLVAARPDAQDAASSPARPPGLISEFISAHFSAQWPMPEPGEPPVRPLQLFDPPQPIDALAAVPDGPPLRFRWRRVLHEIVRAEGPDRIAPEWWRSATGLQGATADAGAQTQTQTRDYYRIEDLAGRRFWVFRLGFHGVDLNSRAAAPAHWFMHGVFA